MIPRNSCVGIRPLNCADENDEGKLCPRCKQYHLRPGYCQALDPVNAAKYPQFHPDKRDKVPSRHQAETAIKCDIKCDIVGEQQFLDDASCDRAAVAVPDPAKMRICVTCGGDFSPKRDDAQCCSPACRKTLSRKQKSPQ